MNRQKVLNAFTVVLEIKTFSLVSRILYVFPVAGKSQTAPTFFFSFFWFINKWETDFILAPQFSFAFDRMAVSGLSSMEVLGMPWQSQIIVDQLTLSQPRGADYAHPRNFRPSYVPDVCSNISSVVEFQRWWVLKSKIFAMW